jgi:hypothetical protein
VGRKYNFLKYGGALSNHFTKNNLNTYLSCDILSNSSFCPQYTGVGKSRFTVDCTEKKDMQVVIIIIIIVLLITITIIIIRQVIK